MLLNIAHSYKLIKRIYIQNNFLTYTVSEILPDTAHYFLLPSPEFCRLAKNSRILAVKLLFFLPKEDICFIEALRSRLVLVRSKLVSLRDGYDLLGRGFVSHGRHFVSHGRHFVSHGRHFVSHGRHFVSLGRGFVGENVPFKKK